MFPSTAIPQRKVDSFVVADVMADLIQGVPSDWGGIHVRGKSGQNAGDWKRLGADLTITNAGFARFLPDGTLERFPQSPQTKAFGGFYVLPTVRPVSSIVGGVGVPENGAPAYGWTAAKGNWQTSPGLSGRGTAVMNRSVGNVIVQADQPLKQNAGFEVNFDFFNYDTSSYSECFLQYGPNVRLALQQGQPPIIQRQTTKMSGATETTEWTTWRRLAENEIFGTSGTKARFAVSQIGGRMVAEWNDKAIWFLDENEAANAQAPVGVRNRAAIPQWGDFPLRLEANGCRVSAELAHLDHLNDSGTAPKVATIVRKVPLASAQSYQPRLLEPMASGFVPEGGDMAVSVSHAEDGLTITTTIKGDEDGLFSPTAAQIYLTYSPVWVNGSGTAVDFTAAVVGGRVTLSAPPEQSGSEGSVSVDLDLAALKCPAAIPLLKDFAPFNVSARWINDTTATPVSDFRGLMQGYIFGSDGHEPEYNKRTIDFTLRDPMVRLHDEAGIVDGNFGDLIFEYQRLTKERTGIAIKEIRARGNTDVYRNPFDPEEYIPVSVGDFYGADAVKYIIGTQLGPNEAARFNGNGDATRFLFDTHPPLLNRLDMAGSLAGLSLGLDQTLGIGSLSGDNKNGFFPPPWGNDCLSWIEKIATDDQCVFFYGHVNRDTDEWPVPIYGQYEAYLDSAKGWKLAGSDAVNVAGLIEQANAESRPETAINRVLVWANPFGTEIPFSPAFVQGEARIASGPDAPHNSYMRTLVLQDGYAGWITTPAQAAAVAATVLRDIIGTTRFYPRYSMKGDARWLIGDVFFASGLGLNINDLYVRAVRIEHTYDVDPQKGRWWETTVDLQPMTNRQIERFLRNHSLEVM